VRRRLFAVAVLAALLVLPAAAASAHPLGNFTTNTYAGLAVTPDAVRIDYVLDLAEIPALQARQRIDADSDGEVGEAEGRRYREDECDAIADALTVTVDGTTRAPVSVESAGLTFLPGQAGLDTLRLECTLLADTGPFDGTASVEYADATQRDRIGWREVTAVGDGTTLVASDVATESISDRLTAYPEDRLASPLDETAATLTVDPSRGSAAPQAGGGGAPTSLLRGVDRLSGAFTDLVARRDLTVGFGMFATFAAVVLGTLHALAPGHGKTVMAAYLIGRSGTARQTLFLALTVAVAHTFGVLLLGVVLSASQTLAPERLYPVLGVASGLLFAVVGVTLLRPALSRWRDGGHGHTHGPGGHAHGDGYGHDLAPGHADGHGSHADDLAPGHDDGHGSHAHDLAPGHADGHGSHAHDHPHGPAHAPAAPTWRSLVAPGLAGGLVPSPSALVVLLGGIALGRAWFGVLLVLAYGVGMAATLIAAGWLLVRARAGLERRAAGGRWGRWERVSRALPLATAALIIVGGFAIAVRSIVAA